MLRRLCGKLDGAKRLGWLLASTETFNPICLEEEFSGFNSAWDSRRNIMARASGEACYNTKPKLLAERERGREREAGFIAHAVVFLSVLKILSFTFDV